MFMLLSIRMVPAVAVVIPVSLMYSALQWKDTYFGMIMIYAMFSIPFSVWILKGFVDGVSQRYDETALINGGSRWHVIFRVILPQVAPGLVAAFIFNLIFVWNEFLFSLILGGRDTTTIPVSLLDRSVLGWRRRLDVYRLDGDLVYDPANSVDPLLPEVSAGRHDIRDGPRGGIGDGSTCALCTDPHAHQEAGAIIVHPHYRLHGGGDVPGRRSVSHRLRPRRPPRRDGVRSSKSAMSFSRGRGSFWQARFGDRLHAWHDPGERRSPRSVQFSLIIPTPRCASCSSPSSMIAIFLPGRRDGPDLLHASADRLRQHPAGHADRKALLGTAVTIVILAFIVWLSISLVPWLIDLG
jgi:hypothetical protein